MTPIEIYKYSSAVRRATIHGGTENFLPTFDAFSTYQWKEDKLSRNDTYRVSCKHLKIILKGVERKPAIKSKFSHVTLCTG